MVQSCSAKFCRDPPQNFTTGLYIQCWSQRTLFSCKTQESWKFDLSKSYQFLKSIYIQGPQYKKLGGIHQTAGKMKERPRGHGRSNLIVCQHFLWKKSRGHNKLKLIDFNVFLDRYHILQQVLHLDVCYKIKIDGFIVSQSWVLSGPQTGAPDWFAPHTFFLTRPRFEYLYKGEVLMVCDTPPTQESQDCLQA